jgi:DNA invertase Pin-like site-specific DNA recombinase
MDALYFRVSSDRQTAQNQFEDLLWVAQKEGSGRDWDKIRQALADSVYQEQLTGSDGTTRTVYRLRAEVASELAEQCVYVEQGKSGKRGAGPRPLFERMKRDAATRHFDRLLVWKVSRLGRDMREVISAVYELADLGVTVVPVKSQTGAITSTLGKLLWAIQAWYAEMENDERAEAIKAGQARARASGRPIGRPKRVFDRAQVIAMRDQQRLSWPAIAGRLHVGVGTVRRAYAALADVPQPCQNSPGANV